MAEYARVIVDISQDKLDKTFDYHIPVYLQTQVEVGTQVNIPFGRRRLTGYVVELTDETECDADKIKDLISVVRGSLPIESQLIALAAWMRSNYGGTMNQALKTVIPVKTKTRTAERRTVRLALHPVEAKNQLGEYRRKHSTARAKLLEALLDETELDWETITGTLGVTGGVIKALEEQGVVRVERKAKRRSPAGAARGEHDAHSLTEEQQRAVDTVCAAYDAGVRETYLLWGVTGSGKTEVYMELIAHVRAQGMQTIVLIPEIALTYQTVMRFYRRFGERVSVLNSRMSAGERYEQLMRAKNGEVDIMVGPRSALFTPFPKLGLIIIDEEHEASYKSEPVPRYHARETAVCRAKMAGASVVLGSATPSLESYYRAKRGEYRLLTLAARVGGKSLPKCEIVDLRKELREGNRSILSRRLSEELEGCLRRGEQAMLFLNRRGLAGFVSCRACGHVIKCPHCDVSLSQHGGGRMVCHYCGHEEREPAVCPSCGSKYISGFKAGTQKIEEVVRARFPQARVLRMDFDTTRSRESYEQILSAFSGGEADILIGTQMIVKGHDFPNVTLMGALAADLSLHVADYRAAERTFALLAQAAGRAGRGGRPGLAIIQTYDPEHYSIVAAKNQDYKAFYEAEILYREMLSYPPVQNMLVVLCASKKEDAADAGAAGLARRIGAYIGDMDGERVSLIGPADAAVAKVNDVYRKVLYLKAGNYGALVKIKDMAERFTRDNGVYRDVTLQFDFNPVNGF